MSDLPRKRLRGDAVGILVVSGLCLVGLIAYGYFATTSQVTLLNGFDVPVRIEVDGRSVEVGPASYEQRRFARGIHTVRAFTAKGEQLEETTIEARPFSALVAYNVLGGAPIFEASVVYAAPGSNPTAPPPRLLGGRSFFFLDTASYVLEDPPKTMPSQPGDARRVSHVGVAKGGWESTFGYLLANGDPERAADLLEAASAAGLVRFPARAVSRLLSVAAGRERARAHLAALRERRPDDLDVHLAYGRLLLRAGEADALRQDYRRRDVAGASATITIAHASAELPEDGLRLLAARLAREPNDTLLRLHAASRAEQLGDAARAAQWFEGLEATPPYARFVDDHVRALLALGRDADARTKVAALAPKVGPEDAPGVRQAEVTLALHAGERPRFARADPFWDAWFLSAFGEHPTLTDDASRGGGDLLRGIVALHEGALGDPFEVWERCRDAPAEIVSHLHGSAALLLALELDRAGDERLARRLIDLGVEPPVTTDALLDYVRRGVQSPELAMLHAETRAALEAGRARVLAERGEDATAALSRARSLEGVRGPVAIALERWSAVAKGDAPTVRGATVVVRR